MRSFLTPLGHHYVGDRAHPLDLEVSPRPSPEHQWVDGAWALDASKVQEQLVDAVQRKLDSEAQALGYDSIFTACTYAPSRHPRFGVEGVAFVAWRDAVWSKCYEILGQVQQGLRPVPTAAEVLAELPPLVL